MKSSSHNLKGKFGRKPSDQELANDLEISIERLCNLKLDSRRLIPKSLEYSFINKNGKKVNPDEMLISSNFINDRDSPLLKYQETEFKSILFREISKLASKQRLVMMLYYYDELTMQQIGIILDAYESRISHIHKEAIIALKKKLYRLNEKCDRLAS